MQIIKKTSLTGIVLTLAMLLVIFYALYTGRVPIPFFRLRYVYLLSNPIGFYLTLISWPSILIAIYVWLSIHNKKFKNEIKGMYRAEKSLKKYVLNKTASVAEPSVHLIKTTEKVYSKIGGKPVVDSNNFIWPEIDHRPMDFLAQIDLKEISKLADYEWLGKSGSILFFYDLKVMPWGFDPKDRGRWRVIYQENPTILVDFPNNLEARDTLNEFKIKTKKINTLPASTHRSIKKLELSKHESQLYSVLESHYPELSPYDNKPRHQVGGFPSALQRNMMEFEAEFASTGTYMGGGEIFKSTQAQDFMSKPNNWRLLFQFDLNDDLGLTLNEKGRLYFWVEKDLSKKNIFENTWVIFQGAQ